MVLLSIEFNNNLNPSFLILPVFICSSGDFLPDEEFILLFAILLHLPGHTNKPQIIRTSISTHAMASSLMCPSSPNSLRLRLGFRCRDSSSSSFLRVRFRPYNRRLVIASVAGESERGGGAGWAWNGSDTSLDAFAGWSDAGSGGGGSENKKGIRGKENSFRV